MNLEVDGCAEGIVGNREEGIATAAGGKNCRTEDGDGVAAVHVERRRVRRNKTKPVAERTRTPMTVRS